MTRLVPDSRAVLRQKQFPNFCSFSLRSPDSRLLIHMFILQVQYPRRLEGFRNFEFPAQQSEKTGLLDAPFS